MKKSVAALTARTKHILSWLILAFAFCLWCVPPSRAAVRVWAVTQVNGYWSTPGNWEGNIAPGNGDDVLFLPGSSKLTTTNDISNLRLRSLVFSNSVSGYVIRGNTLTISNLLSANSPVSDNTLYCDLIVGGSATVFRQAANNPGGLVLNGNLNLNGRNLSLSNNGDMEINGVISGTGDITMTGDNGWVKLGGNSANTYTGTFSALEGVLSLNKSVTPAITGDLYNHTYTELNASGQIADSANVFVSGTLQFNDHSDTIGSLTMEAGQVVTGTGQLRLNGGVTNLPSAPRARIAGNLHLGNVTRTFHVGDGGDPYDLDIPANIAGGFMMGIPDPIYAGIIKTGSGTLRLSGTNTYGGPTTILQGAVHVSSDAGFGSAGGQVTINSSANVQLINARIGDKPLELNRSDALGVTLTASGNSAWGGPVILNTNVSISTGGTLVFSNAISGVGGLTLAGPGTYEFNGTNHNTYQGITRVHAGTLLLNKSVNRNCIPGDLIIGDGSGTDVVRHLNHYQIPNIDITINPGGLLDLNGYNDSVGGLNLTAGRAETGTGWLAVYDAIRVNPSSLSSTISGQLDLHSTSRIIDVANGEADVDLLISASIFEGGLVKNGPGKLSLTASNSYAGPTAINAGQVQIENDYALGLSDGDTVLANGAMLVVDLEISRVKEPLTLSGSGIANGGAVLIIAGNTCAWDTNWVLAGDTVINCETASQFIINTVISGTGNLTKIGPGMLTLTGSAGNSYSGTTFMNEGLLQLDKSSGNSIPHLLVIGDGLGGSHADVVRWLDNVEVDWVTVNGSGLMNLDGHTDAVYELTLNDGGDVQTGAGLLTVTESLTATASSPVTSSISGRLSVSSSPTLPIDVGYGGGGPVVLDISAQVSGSAAITKSGEGILSLTASNTFTGSLSVSNGLVWISNDAALGSTAGGTALYGDSRLVIMGPVNIGQETLTLNTSNSPGVYASTGSNYWAGPVNLLSTVRMNANSGSVLNWGGVISGAGGLDIVSAGPVILSGTADNTYAGNTRVIEGTLELAKNGVGIQAIRYGSLVIGDDQYGPEVVRYTGTSSSQLHTDVPITIYSGGLLDLNGHTDDVGEITFLGGRIQTGSGMLRLFGDVAIGASTLAQARIDGNLELNNARTFRATNSGAFWPDLNIYAGVHGSGGLALTGTGELGLRSSNSFSGPVTLNSGTLYVFNSYALGTTNAGTVVNEDARLILYGNNQFGEETLALSGDGPNDLGALRAAYGSNTWAGDVTLASDTVISVYPADAYLNLLGSIGGSGRLTKADVGTLIFDGATANTYTNTTLVNEGTLVLTKSINNGSIQGPLVIGDGDGGAKADIVRLEGNPQIGAQVPVIVQSSGWFDLGNVWESFGSLAGSGFVSMDEHIDVGYNGTSTIFSGLITGTGDFVKVGSGTMTLMGDNTYTGYTSVSGGTLLVNGYQPSSRVSIFNGAILGGVGRVGDVTVSSGGGRVAPGASTGRLIMGDFTVISSPAVLTMELNGSLPGINQDVIWVYGSNNLNNAVLEATVGFLPAEGEPLLLILNDGNDPITGTFAGLPEGAVYTTGGLQFRVSYVGEDGNDVTLTLTNPPATVFRAIVSAGNGNQTIDPNECNDLRLVVENGSGAPMTGISASLRAATEGVLVTQPYSDYPDLAAGARGTNLTTFQITTLPTFECGANITLELTVKPTSGLGFVTKFILESGSAGAPITFSNVNPLAIIDRSTIESPITVAGLTAPLNEVVVSMFITHSSDADLDVTLIGPDGTEVELTSDNGGSGNNYGTSCESPTTFDDDSKASIIGSGDPFDGTYRPEGLLATFRGKTGNEVNGTWRLRVTDDTLNLISGTLNCWYLRLYPASCASGSGLCETCPGVISGSIAGRDRVQTGRLIFNFTNSTCEFSKTCPGPFNNELLRFDAYTFTNASAHDVCVTVTLEAQLVNTLSAVAYLGSFNRSNICENYLADLGYVASPDFNTFSFEAPAGAVFVVVVHEAASVSTCDYTLMVMGTECPPALNIEPAGVTRVRLDWPTSAGGYQLESTLLLAPLSFNPVTTPPVIEQGRYRVTNNVVAPSRFYRLHKP